MRYKVNYVEKLEVIPAEKVYSIKPPPAFKTNTVHVRVVQGGFMDDQSRWHAAPKRVKEAMRINGWWYWVTGMRDKRGHLVLSRELLMPCL